ncbi:dienelactone hydrolase family protein [Fodinicola feengrottensis]|nr:dienelactone hydrolase family protein [Fodinicola feengrottensis]
MGRKVAFTVAASVAEGYLAVPETGSGPGLLVVGRTAGLTGHVSSVVDRFAAEGFVAFAPDLYHPAADGEPFPTAVALPNVLADLVGAAHHLDGVPEFSGQLGVVGFGAGGGLALAAAAELASASAMVAFYPELEGLADVPWARFRGKAAIVHQSGRMDTASAAVQRRITEAGGSCRVYEYADAEPDFFNDDRPGSYHPEDARTAWARTLELLRPTLLARAA